MPFANLRMPGFTRPNPVAVFAVDPTTNASGDDLRASYAQLVAAGRGTAYMASVQQGSASYAADLAAAANVQAGVAGFRVMFASEPLDPSNPNRPHLKARDLIAWATPSGPVRILYVAGPVRDEGGAGVAWTADCLEIA